MLIPVCQTDPLSRSMLPLLQIHSICLALQALEFLISGSGYFFISLRSREAKPPVQGHKANLWQGQGWTQVTVLSLPGASTSQRHHSSKRCLRIPVTCSFPRASSFAASNLIPVTILGARWWLYPPLPDKEMMLRVVKSDPEQQQWQWGQWKRRLMDPSSMLLWGLGQLLWSSEWQQKLGVNGLEFKKKRQNEDSGPYSVTYQLCDLGEVT